MAKKKATAETSEKKRQKYDVPAEEFIRVWQTSSSAEEAAEKLGMPKAIAHARASNYRMAGIKLKKMPRSLRNSLNVDALNQLIDKINKGTGQ